MRLAGLGPAPASCDLLAEHGAQIELGRMSRTTGGESSSTLIVVLADTHATGISLQHAWLRFDRNRGVVLGLCGAFQN